MIPASATLAPNQALLWRSLIRVVTPGRRYVKIVVPAYGSRRYLTYPRSGTGSSASSSWASKTGSR